MSNDVNTPESEVKETQEVEGSTKEPTEESKQTEKHEKPDQVPIARLNKEITRRKELEKQIEEAKAQSDLKDPEKEPTVQELAEKLAKIEEKEKRAKLDATLAKGLTEALEEAPEFAKVVNRDIVLQMARLPENKDKTFVQLLDEAYGNAIGGKRTIETTTPRGGAENLKVDLKRAQTDAAYRKEVLKDPDMRKQYNEGLENRIML